MNEFALDPKLKVVAEVAKDLGRTERRIQQMIAAGDLAARKATDLEELDLRKAGRIRSSTERGVWLIQQEAVQRLKQLRTDALTETTHSKVGYPKYRPRSKQSRIATASEANRSCTGYLVYPFQKRSGNDGSTSSFSFQSTHQIDGLRFLA